ncbi:ABC-three component system protein [Streptomyces virginiae]|uniref:ABC-three component system protein n=1 Tax=Streptomyces virginiae TaxID=1961 RepID=UPI002DBE7A48|nr:ABC-three component system protein [Streptomyces sp. CMAA1738]MEC4571069.1 ABC-three component system protein [Streptomyces sp. CMAA1738]
MTGYLYQCELALLELARRSWQDPTVEVRMELLDDIEFLDPDKTPLELLQAKHREAAGPLSETGKDFWRSVASWIDALENLSDLADTTMPILRLVSTQSAPPGTFFQYLSVGPDRDETKALERMERTAADDEGPGTTADDRELFMSLTPARRKQLVRAITVNDAAPLMSDLDPSLAKELGITPGDHAQAAIDEIKGWWYGMAVKLLERRNPQRMRASVSAQELMCRRDEVAGRYVGRNLPITETLRHLTQAEIAQYNDRLVVTQMRWIDLPDEEVAMHLRDYHYARAQRSEWLRTFKITPDRIEEYEGELHYEWENAFRRRTRRIRDDMTDEQRQTIGQEILDATMDRVADTPLRPGSVTAPWIGTGSVHGLSDHADTAEPDRQLGWHPDYRNRCKGPDETQEQ